mgnify:CR=1 FL=1
MLRGDGLAGSGARTFTGVSERGASGHRSDLRQSAGSARAICVAEREETYAVILLQVGEKQVERRRVHGGLLLRREKQLEGLVDCC